MTDASDSGFGKFVPGFEFMQNLARQATSGLAQGMQPAAPQLPNLGSWVAPTFNVEELDKRIQELKTVHFWLDQNSRALASTIQALEVQKMTLSTLKGMNVSLGDVANAMKVKTADAMASMAGFAGMGTQAAGAEASVPPAAPLDADALGSAGKVGGMQFAGLEIPPRRQSAGAAAAAVEPAPAPDPVPPVAPSESPATPAAGVVDPMQWWGALTQQFQTIAAQAMQELPGHTAVEAGKHMATTLASEAVKTATEMTAGVARTFSAPGRDAGKPPKPAAKTQTGVKGRGTPADKTIAPAKAAVRKSTAKAGASGAKSQRTDAPAKGAGTSTAKAPAKSAAKGARVR